MPSPIVAVLLAVTLQQPVPQSADSVIAYARQTLAPLSDTATLHKAGYFAIGFGGGTKDLSPFQGQHWLQVKQFLANAPIELPKPTITMFLPVRDTMIPIGVAHLKRVVANTPSPTHIADVEAEWHVHVICR